MSEATAATKWRMNRLGEDGPALGPVYEVAQFSDRREFETDRAVYLQMDSDVDHPTVLADVWAGGKWIGCNSNVYVLSGTLEVREELSLGEPFAGFYLDFNRRVLFVISETAITAISEEGRLLWKASFDVISRLEWSSNFVMVNEMEGDRISLDLETGNLSGGRRSGG